MAGAPSLVRAWAAPLLLLLIFSALSTAFKTTGAAQAAEAAGGCGKGCVACARNSTSNTETCTLCGDKMYLLPETHQCVSICPFTHRAQGFGETGRTCALAKPVAARQHARPGQHTALSLDRPSRQRRNLFDGILLLTGGCIEWPKFTYWTGCNKGGCKEGETEIDAKYCAGKLVWDEQCEGYDYDVCRRCIPNYRLFFGGSGVTCKECTKCVANQWRTYKCTSDNEDDYKCITCGSATVTGKLGSFGPSLSPPPQNQVDLVTTVDQANAPGEFSNCKCPWRFMDAGERLCVPVCYNGCDNQHGSCHNTTTNDPFASCFCDHGWGGAFCEVRYVGDPYQHWCHADAGGFNLEPPYYHGCTCDSLLSQGVRPYFMRDYRIPYPNCGQLALQPSVPLGILTVTIGVETHNRLGTYCAPDDCDPLNPGFSRSTPRDITYFNYGIDNKSHTLSTYFEYGFPFISVVNNEVGGPEYGPMDQRTGVTTVAFGMYDITQGFLQHIPLGSSGCVAGSINSPLTGQVYTCEKFRGVVKYVHGDRFLLFYRVRAEGRVTVRTPLYGTVPMNSEMKTNDIQASERRVQVAITIDWTPLFHCSEDTPGARCPTTIRKLGVTGWGVPEQSAPTADTVAFSVQGWRVPGIDFYREAPIQMMMLSVYTMKQKGLDLMETDEQEKLSESKVHYYKDDLNTAKAENRCVNGIGLLCDPNVVGMSFDNPTSHNMIYYFPMAQLTASLNARRDPAANNTVRATLLAGVLSVLDMAGNPIKTRTTLIFAPDGYEPAAIKVAPGAFLSIHLAVPRELRNVLRRPNGSTYLAPYVWQSVGNSIEVSWRDLFTNDWMVVNVLKQLQPQAGAPGPYDPDIYIWKLPHKRGLVLYQWKIVLFACTAEVVCSNRSPKPDYVNVDQSSAPFGSRVEEVGHRFGYVFSVNYSPKFRFETNGTRCTVSGALVSTCVRNLELYDRLSFFEQDRHVLEFRVLDASGTVKLAANLTTFVEVVNYPPYEVHLDGSTFAELSPVGTVIGSVYARDRESGNPATSLSCPPTRCRCTMASESSPYFYMENNTVLLGASNISFATWDPLRTEILVVCADDGTPPLNSSAWRFPVTVYPVNKPPTGIFPTNITVPENAPPGSFLALLSSTDPDNNERFNYTLVDDPSGLFMVTENAYIRLKPGAVLDVRVARSYTISVRTTDDGKAHVGDTFYNPKSFVAPIVIDIAEAPWPPTDIFINGANTITIFEDATEVGVLTTIDRNRENRYVFELLEALGPGSFFTIDPLNNSRVVVGNPEITGPLDGLLFPSVNMSVRVYDADADIHTLFKTFTVNIQVIAGPCMVRPLNVTLREDREPGEIVGTLRALNRFGAVTAPGALSIVSGGELFEIVEAPINDSSVAFELRVRSTLDAFPFDVSLASQYQLGVSCQNGPVADIIIRMVEANVPPDAIDFIAAAPLYDDAPPGTVVGFVRGYDHNSWPLGGSAWISLTPCVAPLSSNLPPGLNGSVTVLPTNCTSDADDAGGLLRLEAVPFNANLYEDIIAWRPTLIDVTAALDDVPPFVANRSFADLNVTFRLVVARDLWTVSQTSIALTAVAFDVESLLTSIMPLQVYSRFNVPIRRRPRITGTMNSTAGFALGTVSGLLYFTGVDLSEMDAIKIVNEDQSCSDPGNPGLHTPGPHTTQGAGAQFLLNPNPQGGYRTALAAAYFRFLAAGTGHLCFKYANSTIPFATAGWRRIGAWTYGPVEGSAVEQLNLTVFDPHTAFARRDVETPVRHSEGLSYTARGRKPVARLTGLSFTSVEFAPFSLPGTTVGHVVPVGDFAVFTTTLNCTVLGSSDNSLAAAGSLVYSLKQLPAAPTLDFTVACFVSGASPAHMESSFTLASAAFPWPWAGDLELTVIGVSSDSGALAVSEKTPEGTLVGQVFVRDITAADRNVTLLSVAVVDDTCGLFAVAGDGLTLVSGPPRDFETMPAACTVTLSGTVASANCVNRVAVATFDAVLSDVNEHPQAWGTTVEATDLSTTGTVVATVSVFDEDAGQSVSCEMASSDLFAFDASTLEVSLVDSLAAGNYSVSVTCADNGVPVLRTSIVVPIRIVHSNRPPGRAILVPLARLGRDKKWLWSRDDHAFAALDATDPDGYHDLRRIDLIDSGVGAFVLEQGMLRVGQYGDPVAFLNDTTYTFTVRVSDLSGLYTDTRFVMVFEEGGETKVTSSLARRDLGLSDDDDSAGSDGHTLEAHYSLTLPHKFFNDSFFRNRPKFEDGRLARRAVSIVTEGSLTLSISVNTFREDLPAPSTVAQVTLVDTSPANFTASLGMQSGHEYTVFVRAHDVAAVGPATNKWEMPGWPESGGMKPSVDHTKVLTQLVRVDMTPPEILDLYLLKSSDGHDEKLPMIGRGETALLKALRLNAVMEKGEGFMFISDPDLANLRIGYGLYDKESGLRYIRYAFRETSFGPDLVKYNRTTANNTYAMLSGQWNLQVDYRGQAIRPIAAGSPVCDPASYNATPPGHHAHCTYGVAALCEPVSPRLCYCLAYGHDDQCYINYDVQYFGRSVNPIENDPNSGSLRGNRFMYWDNFEMTLTYTITNYAMLSTTLDLNLRIDMTPPSIGFVVDAASPFSYDIDFMETDANLIASWSNFSDHESGIAYYECYFSPQCITAEMYCGSPACVVPESGACVNTPECIARINQTLLNGFRASRTRFTSTTYQGTLAAGKYYATVVAYNYAMTRSIFVCSDGVVVDATKPQVTDVRADGVVIQPGLIKHVRGGVTRMWVLTADGVKHPVSDLSCAANALTIPSPDAFPSSNYVANFSEFTPVASPHTGTHAFFVQHGFVEQRTTPLTALNTSGACGRYGRAQLMQYTESIGLQWNGGDAESGIADYEVAVCAYVNPEGTSDDDGALLVPESTHKQNFFVTVREGAIDDEPRIYYRIRAINRAQAISTVYLGPITVDASPPVPVAPASSITFAPNSTHFIANWPAVLFQTSPSGLCRLDVCFGTSPGSCSDVAWLPAMPIDSSGCNSRVTMPRSAVLSRLWLGALQDGHTYFVTIRATSGSSVQGFLLGPTYVHISTLANKGMVCEVGSRQTARVLQLNDDIDFQSNTTVLNVQWDRFAHAFDEGLRYQAALVYDGQLLGAWSNFTTDLFLQLNMTALNRVLPLHRIAARVRACNVMGCREAQSDGVLILPLGPSTGKVNQGPDCSFAASLVHNGNFTDPSLLFDGPPPAYISGSVLGNLYQRGASVTALDNTQESINALQMQGEADLQVIVSTIEGQPYTISLDATHPGLSTAPLYLEVSVVARSTPGAGPAVPLHTWSSTVTSQFRQSANTWMKITYTFVAVSLFTTVRIQMLDSPATLIDNFAITQCASNPASQANAASVSMHWTGLPTPEHFVSEYQWAVVAGPRPTAAMLANGGVGIPQDRFIVPFTSAGLATSASTRAALPPLTTVFYLVRACYPVPAGCLDPVVSDGLAIDSVPPVAGTLSARYTEENTNVRVIASWPHFQELLLVNGTRTNQTVPLYQWTLAAGITGRVFFPWQPLTPSIEFATPGVTWNATTVTINVTLTPVILPSKVQDHTPPRFLLRAFSSEGIATTISLQARTGFRNSVIVVDVDRFDMDAVNENNIGLMELKDVDVSRSTTKLSAVWLFSSLFVEGFTTIEKPVYEWWIATDRTPQDCSGTTVVRCGTTGDNGVVVTGLALAEALRYYLCIRIIAATGLGGSSVPPEAAEKMQTWFSCSDGVTIDTTPPRPALVRIGALGKEGSAFSSSRQELSVIWGNFADIEEMGTEFYTTGIDYYEVAIGSHPGGEDIARRQVVGDAHSFRALNLSLADGTTYYATVWATDMAALETSVMSQGVTVDSTPPVGGLVYEGDDPLTSFQSAVRTVTAHWSGFSDAESSIVRYEWAIGTSAGGTDLMPWRVPQSDTEALYNLPSDLEEGQTIFVSVRATNGAGLHTTVTGLGVAIDYTPPIGGTVHDGAGTRDIDFQATRFTVGANWGGFSDPQSGIQYYRWAVGRAPGDDDVHPFTTVGLATSVSGAAFSVQDGLTVYATVEACNYAGLCVQRFSDGVTIDASPPIVGTVLDGYAGLDTAFSPMPKTFALHWFDFYDPDSGLAQFEWCAGRRPGLCDQIDWQPAFLEQRAFGTRLNRTLLDNSTTLYGTVRVTNKAGLQAVKSSNGIRVDSTPPVPMVTPQFEIDNIAGIRVQIPDMGAKFQPFLSVLRGVWQYSDPESAVHHLTWSARVHHDYQGQQPVNAVYLTDTNEGVQADIQLADGDKYFLSVHACNGAHICLLQDEVNYLFVDSSPPSPGVVADDLFWIASSNSATIRWYGFHDSHSQLARYYVTLNGQQHTIAAVTNNDAVVYSTTFQQINLTEGGMYRLVIRGVNNGGLSAAIDVVLEAHLSGQLNVLHEACETRTLCQRQFTTNLTIDNGCLPGVGRDPRTCQCSFSVDYCADFPVDRVSVSMDAWTGFQLEVNDGFQQDVDLDHQPFINVLGATWRVTTPEFADQVLRYDWTVGINADVPYPGMGFFAGSETWFPVGLSNYAVFTVPGFDPTQLSPLRSGQQYFFYVRAWLSNKHFRIFRSDGVIVRNRGPQLKVNPRVLDGLAVRNPDYWNGSVALNSSVHVHPFVDLEYQPHGRSLAATWSWVSSTLGVDGMLSSTELNSGTIDRFEWAAGTYPGSTNAKKFSPIFLNASQIGSDRFIMPTDARLVSGMRYYSAVRVYDIYGIYAELTSNGVTVDLSKPLAGNVYDGILLKEQTAQSNTATVSASWIGFRDYESGIVSYEVGVSTSPQTTSVTVVETEFQYTHLVPSDPNVRFVSVGLHLSASLPVSAWPTLRLEHGRRYYVFVRAYNGAGYASDVAVSDSFIVDQTPPLITVCMPSSAQLVIDPSFEQPLLSAWTVAGGPAPRVQASTTRLETPDKSTSFIHLANSLSVLSQTLLTVPNMRYRLSFSVAGFPRGAVQGQAGRVRAGSLDSTFYLAHGQSNGFWRAFTYEFTAWSNTTLVQFNALGNGFDKLLAIDAVNVYACTQTAAQAQLPFTVHLSSGREFAALDSRPPGDDSLRCQSGPIALPAGWVVAADDTVARRIAGEYRWGAACVVLDSGLSYFTLARPAVAGTLCSKCFGSSCLNSSVANGALLLRPSECATVSRVILLERLDAIHVGRPYQNSQSHMQASWIINDPESGIKAFEWAIGTVPGGAQLQPFKSIGREMSGSANGLQLHHGMLVYVTVAATNMLGLTKRFVSNPVLIDHTPPIAAFVKDVDVFGDDNGPDVDLTLNTTALRVVWSFSDSESGLQWCDVGVGLAPGQTNVRAFMPAVFGSEVGSAATVTGLNLSHGVTYFVTVKCANFADLVSHAYSNGVTVLSRPPSAAEATVSYKVSPPLLRAASGPYTARNDELVVFWDGFDNVLDTLRFEFLLVESCPNTTQGCPPGTYYDVTVFDPNARCRPCAQGCTLCTGPTTFECQACALGYRFDGRACYLRSCPQGFYEDFSSSTCWRQTYQTQIVLSQHNYPLQQGCIYETRVRAFYAFGAATRSPAVSAFTTIDITPPVVRASEVVVAIVGGTAVIDWSAATSEDVSPYETYYAIGTESSGRWNVLSWAPTNGVTILRYTSRQFITDETYVVGLRAANAAGFVVSVTVRAVAVDRLL